jgi:hypothetical protein
MILSKRDLEIIECVFDIAHSSHEITDNPFYISKIELRELQVRIQEDATNNED